MFMFIFLVFYFIMSIFCLFINKWCFPFHFVLFLDILGFLAIFKRLLIFLIWLYPPPHAHACIQPYMCSHIYAHSLPQTCIATHKHMDMHICNYLPTLYLNSSVKTMIHSVGWENFAQIPCSRIFSIFMKGVWNCKPNSLYPCCVSWS